MLDMPISKTAARSQNLRSLPCSGEALQSGESNRNKRIQTVHGQDRRVERKTAMKVLIGERPSKKIRDIAQEHGWGQMYIYCPVRPYPGEPWGFDNGAYLDWRNGKSFDEKRYVDALDAAQDCGITPYLAVVPDLVARGRESLDFSLGWLSRLPSSWPWYLAVQDGMEFRDIEPVVHLFDGLFLGGTDAFKKQAQDWCNFAHVNGKRFHYARAGTERKIQHALNVGVDSLDSAFPLWTMERIRRMEFIVNGGNPRLEFS